MNRRIAPILGVALLVACSDAATAPRTAEAPSFAARTAVQGTNVWLPISSVLRNPCTGEKVSLSGSFHVVGMSETTADGGHSTVHVNSNALHGVGLTTGTKYIYATQRRVEQEWTYDPVTLSFQATYRYHVISQGNAANWFATLSLRLTYPPRRIEIIEQSSECRG